MSNVMGKKFWNFFDSQKKIFFTTLFFKKNSKKIGNFFKAKTLSKFFFTFFQKKCPEKNVFFECQKNFQNFFLITFYIFLKIFGPKKSIH